MNIKKVIVFLIILSIILGVGYYIYIKWEEKSQIQEYTPVEEITDEQLRQTIVTLYFRNKETKELMPEARRMDANELIKNPYETLVTMLIAGPKNEILETMIPEGTKINNIEIRLDIVYIDFSQEFINNHEKDVEMQSKTIYSIVNTLTELTEVNAVKILIDGAEDTQFQDEGMSLKDSFVKKD